MTNLPCFLIFLRSKNCFKYEAVEIVPKKRHCGVFYHLTKKILKSLLKIKLKRNFGKNLFTWKISNLLRCIGINARGRNLCTFTEETDNSILFASVTQVSRKWGMLLFQTLVRKLFLTRENEGVKWLLLYRLTTWTLLKLTNLPCLLFCVLKELL